MSERNKITFWCLNLIVMILNNRYEVNIFLVMILIVQKDELYEFCIICQLQSCLNDRSVCNVIPLIYTGSLFLMYLLYIFSLPRSPSLMLLTCSEKWGLSCWASESKRQGFISLYILSFWLLHLSNEPFKVSPKMNWAWSEKSSLSIIYETASYST